MWEILNMISDGIIWLLMNIVVPIGLFIFIGIYGYVIVTRLYDLLRDIYDNHHDEE